MPISIMGNHLLVRSFKISPLCRVSFRQFCLSTTYEKSYFNREVKMMGKLLSPNKKKRRLIFDDVSAPSAKGPKFNHLSGGKETSRRIAVLNSLFIKHISDLLMTGSVSTNVLDKGLEITRVSVAPTFAEVYVYWSANSEENVTSLEEILPKIGFELRHELSQLGVMGFVPRINFIKDKHVTSAMKVDYLLSIADYGEDHISPPLGSEFKDPSMLQTEVFKVKSASSESEEDVSPQEAEICEEETMPVMRQDIFNLDHKAIMDRLLKSMTKSRALHRFQPNLALDCKGYKPPASTVLDAEFTEKNERTEAMNRFIMARRILQHKKMQNKYQSDIHPQKYDESGRKEDDFEYIDDFDDEDYADEDDYVENHRKY